MNPKQKINNHAFAFSADMVLAIVLAVGVLLFLTTPTQPAQHLEERRVTDQYVDDIFVALDHSGYVNSQIDVNGFSASTLQNVYTRAKEFLPPSYDLFLQLKSYPVDVNACRTHQSFEECFPDENTTSLSNGTPLPSAAAFVHGRRIFLKQQPASQCTSTLSPSTNDIWNIFTRGPGIKFADSLNISVDVNVSPEGPLTCDQDITATLSVTGTTGARKPVDMMLVFDRSGSMSYDYLLSTTDAIGLDVDGSYTYIADSGSGIRDINSIDPGLTNIVGTYNSPGTARDVDVNAGYAFIADGTSGLRIVNVSTPASPTSVAQLLVGGDAYGVASSGNTTYVVTYGTDTEDVSNTPSQNQNLTIGQNTSNQSAGQSFQPDVAFLTSIDLYVRRQGSPSVPLLVDIRSSISGAALGTTSIPVASIGSAYATETATFTNAVALTPGTTYYIVLYTASNNASNYYQWGARNGNQYADGQAYQNSSAQSTWDARFTTHFINGLIKINTTTKASPIVLGAYPLVDPWRIFLNGTTAYIADGSAGMKIFNVSGNTPALTGTYSSSIVNAYDVVTAGTTAYISDSTAGVRIVNITTPATPSLITTYNTPGTAYATRLNGTTAYIADGSSIQVINIANPASPVFMNSYTTPWNYRDLEIQSYAGNIWGYIAIDSSSEGLATINLTTGPKIDQAQFAATTFVDFNGWDPTSDQMGFVSYSSTATLDQTLTKNYSLLKTDINSLVANGGTATGDGINTATTHFGTTQADVTNTGSQNQTIAFGQNATNLTAGQSFQPTLPYLSRVDVYIRRVGNPGVPVTVQLRTTIAGTVLASTTIPLASIGTSYALETATFPSLVSVSPGTTYYIVLSTPSNNAANYFQWGTQSGNPYSGGQAYQNSSAQSTWDARFATYGGYTNPTALKFQILMSDGQTNAGANSGTAAITATNNGIVIYTIGFGKDADESELTNIAAITGGKYYAALDQNALIDVYTLIAQQIQLIATDANVSVSIPTGTLIISDGNGVLSGTNLVFDINTQTPQPWVSTYTFNIPCESQLACSSTLISIPSPGTQFEYVDANGLPQTFDWNVFDTTSFNYRDLNIELTGGNILGTNNVDLSYRVESIGNLNTEATMVGFYVGDPSFGNLLATTSIPPLCGALIPGCVDNSYSGIQNVKAEGDLYAVVNPAGDIPECSFNDQDVLFCYNTPATQFYTLDYWAWLHE